jgi:hypothetical protein
MYGLAWHVLTIEAWGVYLRRRDVKAGRTLEQMRGAKSSHGSGRRFETCHAHQPNASRSRFFGPLPEDLPEDQGPTLRTVAFGLCRSIRAAGKPTNGCGWVQPCRVELALLEHPVAPGHLGWGGRFSDVAGEPQSSVERLDDRAAISGVVCR